MNNILDEFEVRSDNEYVYDKDQIDFENYWWKILIRPREAFNYILAEKPTALTLGLLGILAIPATIERNEILYFIPGFDQILSDPANTYLFNFLFFIGIMIFSVGLNFLAGKILSGSGSFWGVALAFVWASLPTVLYLPLALHTYAITEGEGLGSFNQFAESFGELDYRMLFYVALNYIGIIWSLILSVIGLAVAHRFSAGKSVAAHFLVVCFFISLIFLGYLYLTDFVL